MMKSIFSRFCPSGQLDDDALEGRRGDVAEFFVQELVMACDGDHRGVVGGEDALWDEGLEAVTTGIVLDGGPHAAVGRHTATNGDGLHSSGLDGLAELVHQYLDDGALQRGGKIRFILLNEVGVLLERIAQGPWRTCQKPRPQRRRWSGPTPPYRWEH